jgi:membrane-bound lytic murein transglycosylase F
MKKIILTFVLFIFSYNTVSYTVQQKQKPRAYAEIMQSGTLKVLMDYNSVNYFLYKGKPMGFNFDILQEFANYSNLKLEIDVKDNLQDNFKGFLQGGYDILASNLTVTNVRKHIIDFTEPVTYTKQVIVQRKYNNNSKDKVKYINTFEDLFEDMVEIQVRKNSAFVNRLNEIASLMYETVNYHEVDAETESLIEAVSKGHIDYTVCDENIAINYQKIYPNIDYSFAISNNQPLCWAVGKNSELLKNYINNWLRNFVQTREYKHIYARYFNKKQVKDMHNSDYYSFVSNGISEFDRSLQYLSKQIGWDWKLISSLIYQESRFNPNAKSWAGAFGIMQLMPGTAKKFGVDKTSSVTDQIKAGIQLLEELDKRYSNEIEDKEERMMFVLAAYNAGAGHVDDARRLAEKYGKNPNVWTNNVDYFMLQKSNPKYYTDTIVKYGYARGHETYNYVNQIMERYNHYENLLD